MTTYFNYYIKVKPEVKPVITIGNMSSLWDDFETICPKHFDEKRECNNCVHLWNMMTDVNGLDGIEVATRAFEALKTLSALGIHNSDPHHNNIMWSDGIVEKHGGGFYVKENPERLKILCLHLRKIMTVGLAFPNGKFEVCTDVI